MHGLSLLELLIAVAMAGILMVAMNGLVNTALQAERFSRSQNDSLQQARFAMQQISRAVTGSRRLLIPLGENPATAWSESVRSVLAVTLDPTLDRDGDGWADANNDRDYLDLNNNLLRDAGEPERIDEDLGKDATFDNAPGIKGIDDDGDGLIDEGGPDPDGNYPDDDEDGTSDDDPVNGIDDDSDGTLDEDSRADMTHDNKSGVAGVDDDFDGAVDEASSANDDEDNLNDEDWLDPVVFFLNGTTLMQRVPLLNAIDGSQYNELAIAENVSQFQASRLLGGDGSTVLVDISLTLSPPNEEAVSLNTRVRVGGGL